MRNNTTTATTSNRLRNTVGAAIVGLLLIFGFTAGGSADDAVNSTGSSSVSVSDDGGAITNDLGQPELQEMAVYPVKVKFIVAEGGYFIFKKATGGTTQFKNPYNLSFVQGSCYTIYYMVSGGVSNITDRTRVTC